MAMTAETGERPEDSSVAKKINVSKQVNRQVVEQEHISAGFSINFEVVFLWNLSRANMAYIVDQVNYAVPGCTSWINVTINDNFYTDWLENSKYSSSAADNYNSIEAPMWNDGIQLSSIPPDL